MPRDLRHKVSRFSILSWHVVRVNIIMLGFFAAVSDLVSHDALREAVRASVPQGTEELNLSAFDKGYAYGRERSGNKGK
jgi:Pyruvate/2-oxoacid:ferredoxin oxidoreductase gamma subunit